VRISPEGVRIWQRNGFRGHDPLQRTARTPAMSFGPLVPPRHGRKPTPPVVEYLWLVFWYLAELGLLTSGITWIAVTRLRIHAVGGLLPTTLPITGNLAALTGKAATAAGKVLVNARRAILEAVHDLTELLEAPRRRNVPQDSEMAHRKSTARSAHGQRHPMERNGSNAPKEPGTWTGYRILGDNPIKIAAPRRKSRIKDQQPRLLPTAGTSAADR